MEDFAIPLLIGTTVILSILSRPGKRWHPFLIAALVAAGAAIYFEIGSGSCASGEACMADSLGAVVMAGLAIGFGLCGGLIWLMSRAFSTTTPNEHGDT